MRIAAVVLAGLAAAAAQPATAHAEDADCRCQREKVTLTGPSKLEKGRAELSGIALIDGNPNKFMAVSNSSFDPYKPKAMLQIYEGDPTNGYELKGDVELFEPRDGQCADADFEGLTAYGKVHFAIASHSRDRTKQDEALPYQDNRQSLTAAGIDFCASRYQLRRFTLDEKGIPTNFTDTHLLPLFVNDPILHPFTALPSKENGVDIEGIAATEHDLYVGFKGPVLRHNYVPILHLDHNFAPVPSARSSSPLLFVDLGGRGVRDMTAGPGGIYILAGPNGNEDQSFAIYFWDGKDQIGGDGHKVKPDKRCDLGHFDPSGKPEGIAYIGGDRGEERFLLIYDGDTLQAETVVLRPVR
jgi:hypothetical protein